MLRYVLPLMISLPLFTDHTKTIESLSAKEVLGVEEMFKTPEKEYIEVVATFYTARCKGCIGITKSGHNVKNTVYYEGLRILATDESIPLYTKFKVELEDGSKFVGIVLDRGGAIKGNKIDVLVSSEKEAYSLGRQKAKMEELK